MPELGFRSASQLLRALAEREISSRELLDEFLTRIEGWTQRCGPW